MSIRQVQHAGLVGSPGAGELVCVGQTYILPLVMAEVEVVAAQRPVDPVRNADE